MTWEYLLKRQDLKNITGILPKTSEIPEEEEDGPCLRKIKEYQNKLKNRPGYFGELKHEHKGVKRSDSAEHSEVIYFEMENITEDLACQALKALKNESAFDYKHYFISCVHEHWLNGYRTSLSIFDGNGENSLDFAHVIHYPAGYYSKKVHDATDWR